MPKVNIYLPDELFERVKQYKLPVSSICQTALSDVLTKVAASIEANDRSVELPFDLHNRLPLGSHVVKIMVLAAEAAARRGSSTLEPEDVLQGVLDEGESLLLALLEQLGFTRRRWQRELNAAVKSLGASVPVADVVLAPGTLQAFLKADADARAARAEFINGAHVFFAMADQEDSVAASIIRKMGVNRILNREIMALIDAGNAFAHKEAILKVPDRSLQAWMQAIADKLDGLDERLEAVSAKVDAGEASRRKP